MANELGAGLNDYDELFVEMGGVCLRSMLRQEIISRYGKAIPIISHRA